MDIRLIFLDICLGQGADDSGGVSQSHHAVRDLGSRRKTSGGADDAVISDVDVLRDHGADTDERVVAHEAAPEYCTVADGTGLSDFDRPDDLHMILDVSVVAH